MLCPGGISDAIFESGVSIHGGPDDIQAASRTPDADACCDAAMSGVGQKPHLRKVRFWRKADIRETPTSAKCHERNSAERALQVTFFDHKNARKLGVKPQGRQIGNVLCKDLG